MDWQLNTSTPEKQKSVEKQKTIEKEKSNKTKKKAEVDNLRIMKLGLEVEKLDLENK